MMNTYTATFVRWGGRNNKRFTALLADVRDETGAIVYPHVWVTSIHALLQVKPMIAEVVCFDAQTRRYKRNNGTEGYTLKRIRNVRTIPVGAR